MSSSPTTFSQKGTTAFFTIGRPEAGNAMTWAMYDALVEACDRVDADAGIRTFVIRASGGTFCTGTDISQFEGFRSREDGIAYERRLEACVARLETVRVPTIAQVEGIAAGGGCAIALACDLRICTPDAKFGVPIARTLGNALSFENTSRLVDHFGFGRACSMLITGSFIGAAEAVSCGAVSKIAEPDRIKGVVEDFCAAIERNAPLTIRAAKAALSALREQHIGDPSRVADAVADCYASDDFREGVSAFLAKRPPKFTGT
ncbi:MAG TPA: enoyl-CoA hydratase [Vicinamibacterales bacterium]|nr:enoyl-CoA hydratase [Vicinamibacterales bacterium]